MNAVKKTLIVLALAAALFPLRGYGATISYSETPSDRGVVIKVILDSEGVSVNAVEGVFLIDGSAPVNLRLQSSLVPLWVTRPHLEEGTIVFSGVIPGGFQGVYGTGGLTTEAELFSVVVSGAGPLTLSPQKVLVYANDGEGTEVAVQAPPFTTEGADVPGNVFVPRDQVPPSELSVSFISDPSFNGKPVVNFAAFDADSGIAYFEVRENFGAWTRAESPYQLRRIVPFSISVRAVDGAGNTTTKTLPDPWRNYLYTGIALAAFLILFRLVKMRKG